MMTSARFTGKVHLNSFWVQKMDFLNFDSRSYQSLKFGYYAKLDPIKVSIDPWELAFPINKYITIKNNLTLIKDETKSTILMNSG